MKVTILGSGSKGNCSLIEHKGSSILIDAGFSAKQLTDKLAQAGASLESLCGILVTHEHSDHVKGLRVFADLHAIPVYANMDTAEALRYKKAAPERFNLFMSGQKFLLGPFEITPFPIPHDSADATAYSVSSGGKKASFATDLGLAGRMVVHHLKNSDFMLIESNYDLQMLQESKRPWHLKQRIASRIGHLSNEDAAKLMLESLGERSRFVVMGHISEECNCPEKVLVTAKEAIDGCGFEEYLQLHVAEQHEISGPFQL